MRWRSLIETDMMRGRQLGAASRSAAAGSAAVRRRSYDGNSNGGRRLLNARRMAFMERHPASRSRLEDRQKLAFFVQRRQPGLFAALAMRITRDAA